MLRNTFSILLIAMLFVAFSGCHREQKFSREQWDMSKDDGLTFHLRDGIVNDLLKNYKLKGVKYKEIVHLLRYPQFKDSTHFYYEIIDTHDNMHRPDHVKNLVFYMGKDSIITKVALYDNKAAVKSTYY